MLEISGVKEQDFHAIKATHNRKSVSAWGFIWRKRKIRWAKEDAFYIPLILKHTGKRSCIK